MPLFKKKKILTSIINPQHKLEQEIKWVRCTSCNSLIYIKKLEENLKTCPKCGYGFRLTSKERLDLLVDKDTFKEYFSDYLPEDPLNFKDLISYKGRLADSLKKTGINEAIITGTGKINGFDAAIGILAFEFIGGSMGKVMGNKITSITKLAKEKKLPLIIVSASGGARMQEGVISLFQMGKVSLALGDYKDSGGLYISILTNPTYGGVTASFAMLGDIIIAEKGAFVGFAGPRVIEQTIKKKLPPDFQTSEFLKSHGFVDLVVERKNLKKNISTFLDFYNFQKLTTIKDKRKGKQK